MQVRLSVVALMSAMRLRMPPTAILEGFSEMLQAQRLVF